MSPRADVSPPEEPYDEVKGTLRYAQIPGYLPHPVYGVGGVPLRVEARALRTAALDLDVGWRLSGLEEAAVRIVDDAIERDGVEGGGEDAAPVEEAEEHVLGRRTDQPTSSHRLAFRYRPYTCADRPYTTRSVIFSFPPRLERGSRQIESSTDTMC
jgi:hypothetical protein